MTSPDENNPNRGRGFEGLAVILLSLATVGMAWCSYQASGWGSSSSKLAIQSASRGRDAATFRIKTNQRVTQDIFLFGEYLKASNASNEPLAGYYARKFSPELMLAQEVRKRGEEAKDPGADPFATNLYQVSWLAKAEFAEQESERLWYEAGAAAETSQRYTLISVLLAMALFFGGTAPRFERPKKRCAVLALGLAALLTSMVMFVTLPTSKEGWFALPRIPPEFIRP